jgi:hypothetical protein
MIAAAWETLSNPDLRAKYDYEYRAFHTSPGQNAGTARNGTTRTQEWQWAQTNRRTTEDDDIRETKEWNIWLRNHKIQVDEVQGQIKKLNSELEALHVMDKAYEEQKTNANSWWNKLNPWGRSPPTEEELQKMEQEYLQRMAARRVKEIKLTTLTARLKALQKEEKERSAKESERQEKIRQERRREEYERREKERQERERVERERREEAWAEILRQHAERQEEERRERDRRDKERQKREKERQERERQEKEWAARLREQLLRQQRVQREADQEKNRKNSQTPLKGSTSSHWNRTETFNSNAGPSSCRHRVYWDKINGAQVCLHCQQMQYRFLYQCPNCSITGCAKCMKAMKKGTI